MAIACTNCGHELPRDDAHFCNNCGTLVPSHPFSPQSLAAKNGPTSDVQGGRVQSPQTQSPQDQPQKPVLREQMAHSMQRSVNRPALREQMVQQQPRPRSTRRIAPENASSASIQWPEPITHVSTKETRVENESVTSLETRETRDIRNTSSRSPAGERELHVKVWERIPEHNPAPLLDQPGGHDAIDNHQGSKTAIEEAPTTSLEMPELQNDVAESPLQLEDEHTRADIEQLDTVSIPRYEQATIATPKYEQDTISQPIATHTTHTTQSPSVSFPPQQQDAHGYADTPIPYAGMPTRPEAIPQFPRNSSMAREVRVSVPTPPAQERNTSTPLPRKPASRQKSRVPFIILLAVLVLLVLGCGAWVVLVQPFSISPATQPLQSFNDTHLHVALSYPTSWTVQHTATSDVFADSSNTAVFKVSVATDAGDALLYMKQQAAKSGMTATKSMGTASFGGLVWQVLQGSQNVSGANYTTTLYCTSSGGHVYLLSQMAPQSVYPDEESIVFSTMRNSFKLL